MVVLTDSDPSSPTKSQHAWLSRPGTSAAGSEAPRSPYGAQSPEAAHFIPPPPAYQPDVRAPLLPGPPQKPPPARRTTVAKRFCSALAVATVIFIALCILREIIFDSIPSIPISWDNHPRPDDGNVVSCSDVWSRGSISTDSEQIMDAATIPGYPVFSSSKSYSLPINSSLHYIITRGGLSSGLVTIRGDEKADHDRIGVQVVARYHTQHALSRVRICELRKDEGGVGVGVYTPSSRIDFGDREEDKIYFIVTVTIPTSFKSVLELNGFATNTQNFRHNIEGLGDRVHFEHLSLKGTNGAMQADQLSVSQGTLKTTNGKITGKFNATDSLILQTTNGLIDTEVGITNDDTHKASDLVMKTTNGRLTSKISLLTTHDLRPQPKGGHFTVIATTTNGLLDIGYPDTPVDSLLDFSASTSNGPAEISLHPAYEGTFSVSSSGSVGVVQEHVHDPSGKGRLRNLITSKAGSKLIQGEVYWGTERDRPGEMGRANIQTSNGRAKLWLTEV